MGSIAVTVPDLTDADLVFNEAETRKILEFFWPGLSPEIEKSAMSNPFRRLAQTALIVAVDASHALGFVDSLITAVMGPSNSATGLAMLVGKLAILDGRHLFRHATKSDLQHPRIAQSVKLEVARNFGSKLKLMLDGLDESRLGTRHITFVAYGASTFAHL